MENTRERDPEISSPTIRIPTSKPISVVLLCQALVTGGAQRQLIALAIGLHSAGIPVHVLTFYDEGELVGDLVNGGVPYISLGKKGRWDIFGFGWRLFQTLRGLEPTVAYGFMAVADLLLVLLKPFLPGLAIVWGVRASGMNLKEYDWLTVFAHKTERALSSRADLIICNSESGRTDAVSKGFPAGKIVVIPNGIDTERFRFDGEGRSRIRREWQIGDLELLVGLPARLDPMKGHPTFLRAAAAAWKHCPEIRFVCIGDGQSQYTNDLHLLAEKLGLSDLVIWAGSRSDMPAIYSALDIVVSASSFGEGFSNAMGEAMGCERPCVATDVGDSARIVDQCGIAVPANDPAALATAILALARSDRTPLSALARRRAVEEFSILLMVTRTLDALIDVSNQH